MLTPTEIESISRRVIAEFHPHLELFGISSSHGGRVEILIHPRDAGDDVPRRIQFNLPREERSDLEAELRTQLRELS